MTAFHLASDAGCRTQVLDNTAHPWLAAQRATCWPICRPRQELSWTHAPYGTPRGNVTPSSGPGTPPSTPRSRRRLGRQRRTPSLRGPGHARGKPGASAATTAAKGDDASATPLLLLQLQLAAAATMRIESLRSAAAGGGQPLQQQLPSPTAVATQATPQRSRRLSTARTGVRFRSCRQRPVAAAGLSCC